MRDFLKRGEILLPQRGVDPELVAHHSDIGGLCAIPQHRGHRIARDEMNKGKGERREPKCDGDKRQTAPDEIVSHRRYDLKLTGPPPPRRSRGFAQMPAAS